MIKRYIKKKKKRKEKVGRNEESIFGGNRSGSNSRTDREEPGRKLATRLTDNRFPWERRNVEGYVPAITWPVPRNRGSDLSGSQWGIDRRWPATKRWMPVCIHGVHESTISWEISLSNFPEWKSSLLRHLWIYI